MSGGARYWNEETQRWEDDDGTRPAPAPVTPPPPARPAFAPGWTPGESAAGERVPGSEQSGAGSPDGGASGAGSSGADPSGAGPSAFAPSTGGPAAVDVPSGSPEAGPPVVPEPGASPSGAGGVGGWPPAGQPAGGGAAWSPAEWPSASWPPVDEPAAPVPGRGMSRRLVWSVVIGAAAVGVAVSLVLTLVIGSGDDKDKAATESSPPVSPTAGVSQQSDPSPSPTPTGETASPSASAPELPAGYKSYKDPAGFRIAIPEGWSRATVKSQYGIPVVNYRSPDSERRLQVYQVAEGSPAASFDLFLSDQTFKPAGFKKLSLENLDNADYTGSRLEYLADSLKGEPDVGTWHVYDERFVASDGQIYAIAAYGSDADGRKDELRLLTTALDWFCPSLGACEAGDAAAVD
ncbi:hypothetical protein AB0I77_29020 [Streptomyces sp. NPDC050619]|uniref:hypothetical protein n=1 Tax=Streptomyces sp. NPDC050619 TaxID=3157214 RepID=UPI0034321479